MRTTSAHTLWLKYHWWLHFLWSHSSCTLQLQQQAWHIYLCSKNQQKKKQYNLTWPLVSQPKMVSNIDIDRIVLNHCGWTMSTYMLQKVKALGYVWHGDSLRFIQFIYNIWVKSPKHMHILLGHIETSQWVVSWECEPLFKNMVILNMCYILVYMMLTLWKQVASALCSISINCSLLRVQHFFSLSIYSWSCTCTKSASSHGVTWRQ